VGAKRRSVIRDPNPSCFVHLKQAIVTDSSGNPVNLSTTDQHHETRNSVDAKTRRSLAFPVNIDLTDWVAGGNEPPDRRLHHPTMPTSCGGEFEQNGVAIGSEHQS
jgi:hypothetical protein